MATKLQLLVVAALVSSVPALKLNDSPVIDPSAAQNAADVFASSLKEEEPLLRSHLEQTQAFEKDVTDLIMGLSKSGMAATPMKASVDQISKIIKKDMLTKVLQFHKSDQASLNKIAGEVATCRTTRISQIKAANATREKYKDQSKLHKPCRKVEETMYNANEKCKTERMSAKTIKELKCKAYSDVALKVSEQTTNKQIVTKGQAESIEAYTRRITTTICGKPGGGGNGGAGKDGFLDQLLNAKKACDAATLAFNEKTKECKKADADWRAKRLECDSIQAKMDDKACKAAIANKDACESYAECYTLKKVQQFEKDKARVKTEETDRKAEWRGLKRMECLIDSFKDGRITNAEVDGCRAKNWTTGHLTITYPSPHARDKCTVNELYPTTAAYKLQEFEPLPPFAKGQLEAHECAGVATVSTTPAAGSPKSCTCTRVTMSGTFSPKALVKCVNCIDVRRSKDKNSCPSGTKLFSPRSSTDWQTLITSTSIDEVRAPNLIVDVTRPFDGCDNCASEMSSTSPEQTKTPMSQRWQTHDASPWWFAGKGKYFQGKGNYQANCYLDIPTTPAKPDKITFRDDACNYHSKSYYCQPVSFKLTPKKGSPPSCTCKKVELTGSYSAQILVKCEKCLDVYRSNDKNSCPTGTKIFSPRSRADWKTFLASAMPLRSPNWIVDVTRPSNGCGGCTKAAMNSGSAAQATWRTSDGSAWWLRNAKHTQPNGDGYKMDDGTKPHGDYQANCYMNLVGASNEDSILFDDDNCNYHSTSYYCQSVKTTTTTTPVPPPTTTTTTLPAGYNAPIAGRVCHYNYKTAAGGLKECQAACNAQAGCYEFSVGGGLGCRYAKDAKGCCEGVSGANINNYCKPNQGWNANGCKDGSCQYYVKTNKWLYKDGTSLYINLAANDNWSEYHPLKTVWTKVRVKNTPKKGDKTITVNLHDFKYSQSNGQTSNAHNLKRIEWGIGADCRTGRGESRMSLNLKGTPFAFTPKSNPNGWAPHGKISGSQNNQVWTGKCGGRCGYCGFGHAGSTKEGQLTVIDQAAFDAAFR